LARGGTPSTLHSRESAGTLGDCEDAPGSFLSWPFLVEHFFWSRYDFYMPVFSFSYSRHGLLRMSLASAWLLLQAVALEPGVTGQSPTANPDSGGPSALFAQIIANQKQSELILDQYERVQRQEIRKTGSDPKPTETKVWRIFPTGPGVDKIPLSEDGKPPAGDSYRADLEKLEKYLEWIVQDGSSQKEAYAKAERRRKERFELIDATHQAFLFTPDGRELRGDRTLLRYSITPNPRYKPTSRNTTLFTRVRGVVWIDEQSSQLAKIEGTVTEDISLALFLAKVYKGSHFMQERYEVAPGVWEPTFEQYDFDGRKYLLPFSIHERTFYSEYKRVGPPREALEGVHAELNKPDGNPPRSGRTGVNWMQY